MIRSAVIIAVFLLAGPLADGYAETYTWTDEQGTVHFTEDPGKVPQHLRKKIRAEEEIEPPRAESPVPQEPAKAPETMPKDLSSAGADESEPSELYEGRTYADWQKDLAEREAAMIAKRKRIDEIVATLNSSTGDSVKQKKLVTEHKALLDEFKEMKAQYYQQVERARKAGLQINIEK